MPDIDVADFDGRRTPLTVNPNGRTAASNAKPVVLSNEDLAALQAITAAIGELGFDGLTNAELRAEPIPFSANELPLPDGAATATDVAAVVAAVAALLGTEYEVVAAGQTNQVLGGAGALGDLLESLLIVPTSLNPGPVSIRDGAGGDAIVVFAGGNESVSTMHPFTVQLHIRATAAGWRVTTGAGVSVVASGNFS